ncbi:MAG: alpha-ketoglutarate-dependent dioxygenase AlkB [Pseudomonadales bacterium]|jgi:alkylated DNA repair dioxygenase AlkB|nr:alpha-ketoglutarate-dependent dioxygenase AlkB [Pseudomonadales bacterium]
MQHALFDNSALPRHQHYSLGSASLDYYPAWLDGARADHCYGQLLRDTPWRQDTLRFGGKPVLVPRLQAWYGDTQARYGYSGLTLTPLPWTPLLQELRDELQRALQRPFNAVLLNYYRDGNDSVAWHSDDEAELGAAPMIASLSLGAVRRFELQARDRARHGANKHTLDLAHGSLLVMGAGLQQHWRHQLPKQPGIGSSRLNLTFRFIHAVA